MGGLMDIMKDMYDKGDDSTRKMIAEAMIKSREGGGANPTAASSSFGGGDADLGLGGGLGDEDF